MKAKAMFMTIACHLGSILMIGQSIAQQAPPGQGRGQQPAQPPREVKVTSIPGVIAAGAKWKFVWQEMGNNGDGIIAARDGSLLIAQNDNSQVIKLDKDDKASIYLKDTGTGGALSMDSKGRLLVVQRDTPDRGVVYLAPERKVLANTFDGKPMAALGRINDLIADKKGGVYFTVGQAYYASSKGEVTKLSEDLRTNGIILSPNEKTLYITNGPVVVAYDVQPDGKITNRRDFGKLEGGGNGDGLAVDTAGRVYVSTGPGVQVLSPEGKYLGIIPTPRNIISAAFAGPDRKTLYIVARGATDPAGNQVANAAQIYKMPMLAQGLKDRGK